MKASVDKDLCTACGECITSVPSVFLEADDGMAVVKVDVVPADKESDVRKAAEDCPAAAIEVA